MLKLLMYILVPVHLFLAAWSVGGFLEMIFQKVPWKPFTNPAFPDWLLVIHWGSVLLAAAGFLTGYFTHWARTPQFMVFAYGMMAVVCAIETFGYMTSEYKYLAMAGEYLAYTIILIMLYKTEHFSG